MYCNKFSVLFVNANKPQYVHNKEDFTAIFILSLFLIQNIYDVYYDYCYPKYR